jgi:hypothetical protein
LLLLVPENRKLSWEGVRHCRKREALERLVNDTIDLLPLVPDRAEPLDPTLPTRMHAALGQGKWSLKDMDNLGY